MYECKRIFQPIQVDWADSTKGLVRIINQSEIKDVNKYSAVLQIKEDGKIIQTELIGGIDVAPGTELVFSVSNWLPKMKPNTEYHATMRFVLINKEPWAAGGFEIASNQLKFLMIPNY